MEAPTQLTGIDAISWTPARKLAVFCGVAFTGSWTIAFTFQAIHGDWTSPLAAAISVLFTLPPALAALLVKGPLAREAAAEDLGIRVGEKRWWLAAWLIPPAIVALCVALGTLAPGATLALGDAAFVDAMRTKMNPEQIAILEQQLRDSNMPAIVRLMLQGMVSGATFGALIALGEELGWRGFVHGETKGSLLRKALVTGLVWSLWRAPVAIFAGQYPGGAALGLVTMVASTMLLSIVYAYVRERSRSVLPAAVMHGTFNAVAHVPLLVLVGADAAIVGVSGACGFAAITLMVLAVVVHDRLSSQRILTAG